MVNKAKFFKKLNKSGKQLLSLLLALSLIASTVPQNVFASAGDGDNSEHNPAPLAKGRIDFSKALTPNEMTEIGVEPGSIQTMNTTGTLNGMKVDIDVIRGELPLQQADKLVQILKQLEPEIRKSFEADPTTKFQFVYVSDEREKEISLEAREILDILSSINKNTAANHEVISLSLANRLRNAFGRVFDKTSKSDIYWSLLRFAGSGTSATLSFHFGSQLPLPVSMFLGYAVLGFGSANIGLFIEKFTGWLENNSTDPSKSVRNRLGSIETSMLISPLLIGLQETGVSSLETAALLGGTATAAVLTQNVYYLIKKRSPKAAMWYKWYATEALFLTIPYVMAPMWDIYAEHITKTIGSTFLTALFSTMSQGVWDVLITDKLRRPYLEAAIKKDLSELTERLAGKNVFEMSHEQLNKLVHQDEFRVRERFKKYYFLASIISVTSAVTTNTGVYMGLSALTYTGTAGLVTLGSSGALTWIYVTIKNRAAKKSTSSGVPFARPMTEPIPVCSLLFI